MKLRELKNKTNGEKRIFNFWNKQILLVVKLLLKNADDEQSNLSIEFADFSKNRKQRDFLKKQKEISLIAYIYFIKIEKWFWILLKVKYYH